MCFFCFLLKFSKSLLFLLQNKPYDKDDDVIKATYFEVMSTLRDVLKTTSLWRDQVRTYTQVYALFVSNTSCDLLNYQKWSRVSQLIFFFFKFLQHIGDFNYQHLADFGAGISGANKHENQGVLEELDVSSFNQCWIWDYIKKDDTFTVSQLLILVFFNPGS